MNYPYNPSSGYEKFGLQIYNLLIEKFSQTYFVGGMVRDMLLGKEITDIDITTAAKSDQVAELLKQHNIEYDDVHRRFGVVIAKQGSRQVEITTMRKELYGRSRYPIVEKITDPKIDSLRRDFTINALYFSPNQGEILDFHEGLKDLDKGLLRLIGDPMVRLAEDPLRIVRAYRFQLTLQFAFEQQTAEALRNSHLLLKKISQQRIDTEINKISDDIVRQELRKVIHNFA